MSARTWLALFDGKRVDFAPPGATATAVTLPGSCPHCEATPWLVSGGRMRAADGESAYPERFVADGVSRCCMEHVGILHADISGSTIFGREEDMLVLNGRARVYG